jgi:hypothetical protein
MTHSNPTLEQVAMLQARSERLQRLREMLEVLIASEARVGPLELGALLEVADSAVAPVLCKAVHLDYGKDGGQQCELPAEPKHTLHRMNCVQWESETADWPWKAIESSVKVLDGVAAPPPTDAPGVDLEAEAFDYWPPGSREDFCRAVPLSVAQAALRQARQEGKSDVNPLGDLDDCGHIQCMIERTRKMEKRQAEADELAYEQRRHANDNASYQCILESTNKLLDEQRARAEAAETALAKSRADRTFQWEQTEFYRKEQEKWIGIAAGYQRDAEVAQRDCKVAEGIASRAQADRESAEREAAGLRERCEQMEGLLRRLTAAYDAEDFMAVAADAAALLAPPHAGGEEAHDD